MVGRSCRRARLGPRRARHEEPGRSERGRVRVARAGGFRAGRRSRLHRRRRRGGRRVVRARVALRRAPGRRARRLRGERGRRRARRARWQAVLPLRERGEDDRAVPAAGARAERPRLRAGNRRQRARQGGAADRGARRLSTGARAHPRGRGVPRRRARRAAAAGPDPRPPLGGGGGCGGAGRAAALADPLADDHRRVRAAERDPCDLRCHRRLPHPAREDARGRRADHPRRAESNGCGRGRLRARVPGALGRDALAHGDAALARDRGLGGRNRARRESSRRSAAPVSPTRTGCATPSAPSRTASSRCGRWIPSWPRG